jgi:ribonucleotide reductase alpha subunit
MNLSGLSKIQFKESKDVFMKVKVNNVTEGEEKFVVARVSEGELWYYGRYEEERAKEVAEEIGGIVVEEI